MRSLIDARLRAEAVAYELRYSCEDCVHFEPVQRRCAEGYPNAAHRDRVIEAVADSRDAGFESLEFCKSFELS